MKRVILPLLAALALWSAQIEPQTVETEIASLNADEAVVPVGDIPEGVSGIVIHRYNEEHSAIVSAAVVTRSGAEETRLALKPWRGLVQPNLPTVKTRPQKGDKVILGYLYDRVLPIVPNQKSYEFAKEQFTSLHFLHPDLFAAELSKAKNPLPTKEDVQLTCEKFHLGIVMFMFKDHSDFIDCVSWKRVARSPEGAIDPNAFKQPFYNRFERIHTAFYDWGDHNITDFDRYYQKLENAR
jgi:hypothetical protein